MMENNYMMENNERNVLELLLQMEIPKPKEKRMRLRRLSEECGEDVVFTLRQVSYSRMAELRSLDDRGDMDVHAVLAGVVNPNLKDRGLLEKYKAATPAELVKKMLVMGEIADLSNEIIQLSGYVRGTIEVLEKNAQTPSGT